jgi:hypothetical protein
LIEQHAGRSDAAARRGAVINGDLRSTVAASIGSEHTAICGDLR